MDILHTVESYAPEVGGCAMVVQQLSERLVRRGHRVVVATGHCPDRSFKALNGVELCQFAISGSHGNGIVGKDAHRYQNFLRASGFDVMMNFAAQQWATDLAFGSLEETRKHRANVIVPCGYSALSDSQTLRWPQYRKYFNHIVPRAIPLYDAAVYNSTQYQDYQYAVQAGFANSIIIPNAADETEFAQPPAVDFRKKYKVATEFMALCVANFYTDKGHDRVLDCFQQMKRSDLTLVFIGQAGHTLPQIKARAAGWNVQFLVGIPRMDVVAAFHSADLFLFGSYIEASPLVIIEAKASRTPFVSTDCGNVRDWKGGVVCSPTEMAAHGNQILDDAQLRECLAEEGWKEWKERLTWEAVVDRFEELYSTLVQAKRQRAQPPATLFLPLPSAKAWPRPASGTRSRRVVGILFSKDRALQLDATLHSFALNCTDRGEVDLHVLYKTTSARHERQYRQLARQYPEVRFVPEKDFRAQTIELVEGYGAVLFLVDDNIFVRPCEILGALAALEQHPNAIGFSLRLGTNTTFCYSLRKEQALPYFAPVAGANLKYRWSGADSDFGYPLEISSSLYRTCNILPLLRKISFRNPNTLEAELARRAPQLAPAFPELLCHRLSVTFCNPLNRVQTDYRNRVGRLSSYSIRVLARRFESGYRLNVASLANFNPNACHQEVPVQLVRQVQLAPEQWKAWPQALPTAWCLAAKLLTTIRQKVQRGRHLLGRLRRSVLSWARSRSLVLIVPAVSQKESGSD
jgi:glycosyltransferase involved in cell wall biosynthesis